MQADDIHLEYDLILQMLAEATINCIDEFKPNFLFGSAGKDSNCFAPTLAEADWQDKATLITYKSKDNADEGEISANIAKKLKFKYSIMHEFDQLTPEYSSKIVKFFANISFLNMEFGSLVYPLYLYQLPELRGANIIVGMGNDIYIGHIPDRAEFKRQQLSKFLKHSRKFSKYFASERLMNVAGLSRSEWTGLVRLSYADAKKMLPCVYDVSDFWLKRDNNQDYLDFRSSICRTIIDKEIFI